MFPRYKRSKLELLHAKIEIQKVQNGVKELDVIVVVYGYYTTANNRLLDLSYLFYNIKYFTPLYDST